jgi:ATP-binding cassette subfamily B protein
VVKTFGHRTSAQERFRELNDDVYQTSFGAQFISGLVSPATMFIGNLSYVVVAVVGGLQVATGQITVGSIQAFIQYVRQFSSPISQVAAMYNVLQSGVASAERVFNLLDEPEEPPDREVPRPSLNGQIPPSVTSGRVEFQHVNFAYRPGTPVIEDLSLVAEPGSTVAIVGPTGAGKTTLVNLLGQPTLAAFPHRHGAPRHLALWRNNCGEHRLRTPRSQRRRGGAGRQVGLR